MHLVRLAAKQPALSSMSNAVLSLVQSLAPAVAYKESNLESNKKVWDFYAKVRGSGFAGALRVMQHSSVPAAGRGGCTLKAAGSRRCGRTGSQTAIGCARWPTISATSGRCGRHAAGALWWVCPSVWRLYWPHPPVRQTVQGDDHQLVFVGDEWSDRSSLDQVLEDFVFPFCPSGAVCGEIGSGGGRVAARVIPHCSRFNCFDISKEMLRRARESISAAGICCLGGAEDSIGYTLLTSNTLPPDHSDSFDFLYSFGEQKSILARLRPWLPWF